MRTSPHLYAIWIALQLSACTTLVPLSNGHRLTLNNAEAIRIGLSTKDDIKKLFGEPTQQLNLVELPDTDDDGEIWHYRETPNSVMIRLSFYFCKNSPIVSGVGWHVKEGEAEHNIDVAKRYIENRFKNVHFTEVDEGWINDAYSDTKYFKDPKNGITISYRMYRKEVWSISWGDPQIVAEMAQKEQQRKLSSVRGPVPECERIGSTVPCKPEK